MVAGSGRVAPLVAKPGTSSPSATELGRRASGAPGDEQAYHQLTPADVHRPLIGRKLENFIRRRVPDGRGGRRSTKRVWTLEARGNCHGRPPPL